MRALYAELRDSAEEAVRSAASDGGGRARSILARLDSMLFDDLYRMETAPSSRASAPARAALLGMAFYRRGILHRLVRDGVRPRAEHLRALYSGSGSDRLILLVTHSCQLRCAYCRVRKYGASMGDEVAEAGVRWLMRSLRRDVELQFFGGEPLLVLPLVRRSVLLAERLAAEAGKTVRFLLTTNGMALGPEAASFMRDHRFCVEVSCDGSMQAQDSQRPTAQGQSSWAGMRAGLDRMRRAGVPYQVISVILPEDASHAHERVAALAAMGHRRIQINYALGRYWTAAQAAELRRSMVTAGAVAAERGAELVNLTQKRREPVVLNSELTVDCDGTVFRETGVCLEEDFQKMKERFRVEDVRRATLFESYGATQFDNFAVLASAYAQGSMRRTLVSNLKIGRSFAETA